FVTGAEDVAFLRRRHAALQACPLFAGMKYSESAAELNEWMPLVMASRAAGEPLAATWAALGTDAGFGALTPALLAHLQRVHGVGVQLGQEVVSLRREEDHWLVTAEDTLGGARPELRARFVFIGAGGGALRLLEKCAITEGEKYGGFPVSGEWL